MDTENRHAASSLPPRRHFLQLVAGTAIAGAVLPSSALGQESASSAVLATADAADLAARAEKEIRTLREQKLSCAQATFLGLCRAHGVTGLSEEQLLALSAGFAGGIGRTFADGTCGALVAGVMAAGLCLPGQTNKAIDISRELFERFKKREGTVLCQDILERWGRFGHCTDCCLGVGRDVVAILSASGNRKA